MATFLHRLGRAAHSHRVLVVLTWILLLVAAAVAAATLRAPFVSTFEIPGQESTDALELLDERFPATGADGASARVVFDAPEGERITDPANAGQVVQAAQELAGLPQVSGVSNPFDPAAPGVSPDQRAAYVAVNYEVIQPQVTDDAREALFDAVERADGGPLTVAVGGDATQEVSGVGGVGEVVGVVVALLVLTLTYGTLVAAGMNLLTAVVGVGIGAAGTLALTRFVELQSTTPTLALMLGLAVGIDYALFIGSRYRQELLAGRSVPEAVALATGTAGSAVVTAGTTVVIALVGLVVARIPFLTQMGFAAAATVVIAVLVAITLVPAALSLLGRRVMPKRLRAAVEAGERPGERPHRFLDAWGRTVTTHRWLSLLAAVVVLGVVALPVADMQTSLPDDSTASPGTTQRTAYDLTSERFGPGVNGPLLVLLDGEGAGTRVAEVAGTLGGLEGVAFALPQPAPDGPPRAGGAPSAGLVTVIPETAPTDPATTELVHTLRERLDEVEGNGLRSYVTGQTAVSVDVSQQLREALPRYLVLVVGLALLLLVLVFRSILVPLTAVLGFLLTIGAALGATTAVFQWGWLQQLVNSDVTGPLLSMAPIIVVGILFGLAMDYQVFLVSRMHEAHSHGAGPRQAVVTGFHQAAPVVVAAAVIMFAVFAGFVPEGDATVKPIAFALAVGILADALVVRMVAVPAALSLLGRSAWWLPRWLHWLPVLDVEGAALERRAPEQESTAPAEAAPR
ncbi:RND superfamily putative drug exporter [Kineococcus xinjiangensis]|uniref:RND superfamily putative drug exporter n=1 Tax=Kineococcus xinjiangensis TaxID=512762 RepID=A0A2S6ITZ2_9ACTN|nr:MMPL family transporter [Kineococcus xinjiangensis]PPK97615.1 RND superfamily putative drug exporter [Kineococcus xinjiangensis]